jgi:hypothetical protein
VAAQLWDGLGYVPSDSDLQLGKALRGYWWELATSGQLSSSSEWQRFSATDGFPNYFQGYPIAVGAKSTTNFKGDVCSFLHSWGIGQGDWWVN